jgi:hypothetical protein
MAAKFITGQKVRIIGSRFAGSLGKVQVAFVSRDGTPLVNVQVWTVGPGVILNRGDACLVSPDDLELIK